MAGGNLCFGQMGSLSLPRGSVYRWVPECPLPRLPCPAATSRPSHPLLPIRKQATSALPGRCCSCSALLQEVGSGAQEGMPGLRRRSQRCWGSWVGRDHGPGEKRRKMCLVESCSGGRKAEKTSSWVLPLAPTYLWPCPGPEHFGRARLAGSYPLHLLSTHQPAP